LLDDIAVGHFQPINSNRFLGSFHESIFHFTKEGNVKMSKLAIGIPYQDKSNISRWKAATEDRRDRGDVWSIPYDTVQSNIERPHPARLPEMCIKLHGVKLHGVIKIS